MDVRGAGILLVVVLDVVPGLRLVTVAISWDLMVVFVSLNRKSLTFRPAA